MTGKMVIVVALLAMAGCARNDQLACGPALPPIAAAPAPARVAVPVAAAAPAVPVAMVAPVAAPAPTAAELRAQNPLENRAAVAGR